ncbi:MAG: rhodanese-like domain-containing protein [Candidatus Paceibacterota bacterium]
MNVKELKDALSKGENILLLDIREKEEIEETGEKIEGSQNMPMSEIMEQEIQGELPKDKKIITFCRSGGRSQLVVQLFEVKGYDIDHLEGGIEEWKYQ